MKAFPEATRRSSTRAGSHPDEGLEAKTGLSCSDPRVTPRELGLRKSKAGLEAWKTIRASHRVPQERSAGKSTGCCSLDGGQLERQ